MANFPTAFDILGVVIPREQLGHPAQERLLESGHLDFAFRDDLLSFWVPGNLAVKILDQRGQKWLDGRADRCQTNSVVVAPSDVLLKFQITGGNVGVQTIFRSSSRNHPTGRTLTTSPN